jgi:formate-dependent nitrite reductase cytochrome c552 subunit
MQKMTTGKNSLRLALALTACVMAPGLVLAAVDHSKIVGPEKCADCHKQESAAWMEMKHFKTFNELHRRPEAKEIATKLEILNIKTEGACMDCHYTVSESSGRAIAGVSCESCHGAAADWITVHNEKGRKQEAAGLGFISPTNIYKLASNCFSCHTVPNEKLVNQGGHQAGSPIELVAWTQGEVRHHFKSSSDNAEATPERKRMLYVVGRVVDLEYSLRGVANATEKATYAVSMARRAKAARAELQKIIDLVPREELQAIATAADGAALKLNNHDQIMAAVAVISELGQKISDTYKGEDLAAIDPLIPTAFQGTPYVAAQ